MKKIGKYPKYFLFLIFSSILIDFLPVVGPKMLVTYVTFLAEFEFVYSNLKVENKMFTGNSCLFLTWDDNFEIHLVSKRLLIFLCITNVAIEVGECGSQWKYNINPKSIVLIVLYLFYIYYFSLTDIDFWLIRLFDWLLWKNIVRTELM